MSRGAPEQVRLAPAATDPDTARTLGERSQRLTGVQFLAPTHPL
ncbi:hypothetical protein [Nocardia sp. alder85J]|nr:hypothetical protein [Nocardia sp. alder85J]MCX4095177.1 hypothetical protein [Nocardia sp. alder85J]